MKCPFCLPNKPCCLEHELLWKINDLTAKNERMRPVVEAARELCGRETSISKLSELRLTVRDYEKEEKK